jgi:NADH:ubiquinone oxidoreductase subunit 5 (subunit L)/multisubunit Na+/H+ antiporter MnhA subunit
MTRAVQYLWLIPVLPLVAAGLTAVAKQRQRKFAASLAIGSMAIALVLSCFAFAIAIQHSGAGEPSRQVLNFRWFQLGNTWVELGWVLDPLSTLMLVMVSLVGLLIFIRSSPPPCWAWSSPTACCCYSFAGNWSV